MSGRGRTVALLVAAGSGTRAASAGPKQYLPIAGKPILAHAIDHLRHPAIDEIRVVIGPGQEQLYAQAIGDRALPAPVAGGETRRDSVRNGLEELARQGGVDTVLIHDAARPFVPEQVLSSLLGEVGPYDGAAPGLPIADTLVRFDGVVGDNISRDHLYRVQTPQAFRFDAVLDAHRQWPDDRAATDDLQMLREAGRKVVIVPGSPMLEKITMPDDFARAEQMLESRLVSRTGLGFDVHALADGEELWLGGLRIPHDRGLKGHSDADVVLHALTDALLGAVGAGDIGDHFPPSDPKWKGAASSQFVEHAMSLIQSSGGRLDHVDLTIICEEPRIGPHREAMRAHVSALLQLPVTRTSIKATTTERLGFTGRGEGIAAQAIVTVRMPEAL